MAVPQMILCSVCREAIQDRDYYAHSKKHQGQRPQVPIRKES